MPELTPRQRELIHTALSSMLSNIDDFNDAIEADEPSLETIKESEVEELIKIFPLPTK